MILEQFDEWLSYVNSAKATDLHLCPGSVPLIRQNSRLVPIPGAAMVAPNDTWQIICSLLDDSKLERLAHSRTLDCSFSRHGLGRFRCNMYSQRGTFALAIRVLPFEIPAFDTLGLPPVVESFVGRNKGLFLVTGATGSGKSTTLASLMNILNERYSYHIITIEDPVEYLHRHKKSLVTQREIGEDSPTFADALRAALREDPNVIMVGEMRDAETGHLVFSTLHTVGAAKTIDRVIDGVPSSQQNQLRTQLATVLEGVVSQQLIPRADGNGMVVASEVMVVNPAIRNLIRESKHYQINSVMQTGQSQGMQLLEADIARLYRDGVINLEEAQIRAQDPQLLNQFLNRR